MGEVLTQVWLKSINNERDIRQTSEREFDKILPGFT